MLLFMVAAPFHILTHSARGSHLPTLDIFCFSITALLMGVTRWPVDFGLATSLPCPTLLTPFLFPFSIQQAVSRAREFAHAVLSPSYSLSLAPYHDTSSRQEYWAVLLFAVFQGPKTVPGLLQILNKY